MSKKNGAPRELTPVSEWGVPTQIVELPSGKVVKLKRLNVLAMIQRGDDVPNFLKSRMMRQMSGSASKKNTSDDLEDPSAAASAVVWLVKNVFVYPKIVDDVEPQADDEVSIDLIDPEDMMFAASYGIGDAGVVQQLETFRNEASGDVEPVSAGADVEPEAEPDTGD